MKTYISNTFHIKPYLKQKMDLNYMYFNFPRYLFANNSRDESNEMKITAFLHDIVCIMDGYSNIFST